MAVKTETFNQELFDLLKTRGYNPRPLNSVNQEVNPENSDVFAFKFSKNGKNHGTGRVSIDDTGNLILYTSDQLEDSPESNTSGTEYSDSWTGFKKHLRSFAKKRMLNFEIRNEEHLHDDMKKRTYMKKKEKVVEGYYPAGKKASYSDNVPTVKILIQHTRQIEEGEQRYRNVARIFVENVNGERFLLPTKRPGIAKVYARHIAEGGTPYDERGKHITNLVEEYTQMAGFVRATKNGQFNESAQRLVNEGINHYSNLRETLTRMISQRGYHKYFDSYTPVLNEETDESTTINELFVQETLDPRIESVMPILARLSKNINEMSEVKELDEWAEKLVNETLEGSDDIEEGKLAKAAMLGLAGMAALNPMAAKAGGISLPGSGGAFNADQQVQLNKSMEQQGAIEELQKFLAKQGLRQTISGELDNVTYDNIMKASQMHDAGKMSPEAAKMFQSLSSQAGLLKEGDDDDHPAVGAIINRIMRGYPDLLVTYGPGKVIAAVHDVANRLGDLEEIGTSDVSAWVKDVESNLKSGEYDHIDEGKLDEIGIGTLKLTQSQAEKRAEQFEKEIERLKLRHNRPLNDKEEELMKKYELAVKHYRKLASKAYFHPSKMDNIKTAQKMTTMLPAKFKNVAEGPADEPEHEDTDADDKRWDDKESEGVEEDFRYYYPGATKADIKKKAKKFKHGVTGFEEDVEEGLDANQKAAGQLGPTEPVGKNEKNLRGKLVGASESVEMDRLKILSGIK